MKSADKNSRIIGIVLAIAAIAAVFVTEQYFKPAYAAKSAVKLCCFAGAIVAYSVISHRKLSDVINLHKLKNARALIVSALFCFVGIGIAFTLFKNQIDLAAIRQSLMSKENLTKENCLFVFAYIILVNSFLEESFFRGFLSHLFTDKKLGYVISAVLFALYHIGIVAGWFNPLVFVVSIAGLAVVALFLQWLSDRYETIAASWLAHGCANLAINIIGALLIFELIG